MNDPVHILLVEDDEDDYLLTRDVLEQAFGARLRLDWVRDWDRGHEAILGGDHDVCLVDYRLGARDGLELIRTTSNSNSRAPVIMLTGLNAPEVDRMASEAGAADYLVKNELTPTLMERAIRYAIRQFQTEAQLRMLALYDPLTGTANRALFHDRLVEGLAQRRRDGAPLALLLMDLDHFKEVNDKLGHPAGDALLKEVARRLLDTVRHSDTVARLGGDEFAVIAPRLTEVGSAATLADKLMRVMAESMRLEGEDVSLGMSLGIALAPEDGDDPDTLFKHADVALYQAKGEGRGGYRFYDPGLHASLRDRREMRIDLALAIERGELSIAYQPKVHCATGELAGAEALLRWRHPKRGMIPPAEFIPLAERTGQIVAIGDWVLRAVCGQIANWQGEGMTLFPVAVNVSLASCARRVSLSGSRS